MRVMLIGGAGFIGSHIAERLVAFGHAVTVIDNWRRGKPEWLPKGLYSVMNGDITKWFSGYGVVGIDAIVNLASILIHESQLHPEDSYEINCIGALNAYILTRQSRIKTFVHFSSASIYGEPRQVPTAENALLWPTTVYGAAKLRAEEHLRMMEYGPRLIMLRPYNVYGRRQSILAAYTEVLPAGRKRCPKANR